MNMTTAQEAAKRKAETGGPADHAYIAGDGPDHYGDLYLIWNRLQRFEVITPDGSRVDLAVATVAQPDPQPSEGETVDELRDVLDDAIRRAYCAPVRPPVEGENPETVDSLAVAAVIGSPDRMRHLAGIQKAAWATVSERIEAASDPQHSVEQGVVEAVTQAEHESALENVAWRAICIYEETIKDAAGERPDQIESGDGETWSIPMEKRAHAIAHYAHEFGITFPEVRCTRRHMCIDTDAITERAAELACEDPDDVGEHPIAYTWIDDGYMWCDCEPGTPGAVAFWRCEQKSKATTKGTDHA